MEVQPPMTATHPVHELLTAHGLSTGPDVRLERLAGGVSSDIWLVDDGWRRFVVKQPLAQLRVAEDWSAPVTRSDSEAGWLQVVGSLVPGVCPRVLAHDTEKHFLALEYLEPTTHALWKTDLLAGRVAPLAAARVGDRLGAIHRMTSARPELAEQFATDDLFTALRIEPYFLRLVDHHPEISDRVVDLAATTLSTRKALVHGDVSPKNILLGPDGPVFLDAETAWWGDPAFDVAFCVNHLLLKGLLPGAHVDRLETSVAGLLTAYQTHVVWEDPRLLLRRVAGLLPALLLARVDGRSPVDYLDDDGRAWVRDFALTHLTRRRLELPDLIAAWKEGLS